MTKENNTRRATAKKGQLPWPAIYKRTHRSGNVSFVVDLGLINGKRQRHCYKTKELAETFAEQAKIQKTNSGLAAFTLSNEIRLDAAKASELLKPHGVSLYQAAKYYLDHVISYQNSPLIEEIVRRMVSEAEANGRRERTIGDLKNRLEKFAGDFPGSKLSEIGLEDIKDWIAEEEWAPQTRINYLTKLSQLFNYAIKHGWAESNLIDKIDRPDSEDKEPGIFTVDQAKALLENAGKFQLLPYISIGLFAGLRATELMRLQGNAIRLDERAIVVGADVAKKRSRRIVEMSDALIAWLSPALPIKGLIVDGASFRDNLTELRKAAGISVWPHNGLRHSFGSYHLAMHGDAVKTANQMGHRDSTIVHNHYKALILKSEAEKYWALRPPTGEISAN